MLYVNVVRGSDGRPYLANEVREDVLAYKRKFYGRLPKEYETRNDWRTFDDAKEIAALLGPNYIAIDNGTHVSPRYDVIKLPQVGDKVSYAFNGDYYPCGEIASISKSLRLIATTEGQKFYRRGETGVWKYNQTWALVAGHVSKLNPEF